MRPTQPRHPAPPPRKVHQVTVAATTPAPSMYTSSGPTFKFDVELQPRYVLLSLRIGAHVWSFSRGTRRMFATDKQRS